MNKKHHAHIVTWRDSCSRGGWSRINTLGDDPEVAIITSVGWLIRANKREITITTSLSDHGSVMDPLTIPREAVTKMTKLKYHIAGN